MFRLEISKCFVVFAQYFDHTIFMETRLSWSLTQVVPFFHSAEEQTHKHTHTQKVFFFLSMPRLATLCTSQLSRKIINPYELLQWNGHFCFQFYWLTVVPLFCSWRVSPHLQLLQHQLFPASQERHHLSGTVLSSFSIARLQLCLMVCETIDSMRNAVPWLSSTAASSWLVLASLFLSVIHLIAVRCFTIAPKPSSVSSQNGEHQPGAAQPVQQTPTKEPSAQSQWTHTR